VRSEQILARRIMDIRPDLPFKQNAKDWWSARGIWVMPNRVEGRVRVSLPHMFANLDADTLAALRGGLGDVRAEPKGRLSFLVVDGTDMSVVSQALALVPPAV
jgi:hypothetical protein